MSVLGIFVVIVTAILVPSSLSLWYDNRWKWKNPVKHRNCCIFLVLSLVAFATSITLLYLAPGVGSSTSSIDYANGSSKNSSTDRQERMESDSSDSATDGTDEPVRVKTHEELAYEEAVAYYDILWAQLCEKSAFGSSEIDSLKASFSKLVNAVKQLNESKLNEAAGSSLVNSDLRDRVLLTIALLEIEIERANGEYDEVMNLITGSGGAVTEELKDRLSQAVSDVKGGALAG